MLKPIFLLISSLLSLGSMAKESSSQPGDAAENDRHQYRLKLNGVYQSNNLRDDHPLNPGLRLFNESAGQLSLDTEVDSDWSPRWKTSLKLHSRYLYGSAQVDRQLRFDSYLLEGAVQWTSTDNKTVVEFGRSRPQWSSVYNYDIANMLQPNRRLPFLDQDDAMQRQGWDMVSATRSAGPWSIAGYLVASDSRYRDADTEAVVRIGHRKKTAFSLLLHKIDGAEVSFGGTYNGNLTRRLSLRSELTVHRYRDAGSELLATGTGKTYRRFVVGSTYVGSRGWLLVGDYFFNGHGASRNEWKNIYETGAVEAATLAREGRLRNYQELQKTFSALDYLRQGWLRKNYLSLTYISQRFSRQWQVKVNTQIGLDDKSMLHRFELLKDLRKDLSGRLQFEFFNGCSLCEFGLNPNTSNVRLTINWTL